MKVGLVGDRGQDKLHCLTLPGNLQARLCSSCPFCLLEGWLQAGSRVCLYLVIRKEAWKGYANHLVSHLWWFPGA